MCSCLIFSVDVGEETPRTVCSGLVGSVPLEEIQVWPFDSSEIVELKKNIHYNKQTNKQRKQAKTKKNSNCIFNVHAQGNFVKAVHMLLLQRCNILNYYSFKIFPRFGLVETTHIIHHNQLLFTKFGKNLCHIQSMMSKVEPAANYSIVDVKITSKVEPAADYSTVDRKNLGTRL